jgi:Carboxypeptidase regulatory-like domain
VMCFRKHAVALLLLVAIPSGARAQADSVRRGEVFGTVYDSVARRVVEGATVQLVLPSNPGVDSYMATTDARGRFLISGVRPGRYVIGFQHPALDSLALESPLRAVDVRAGERTKADLAVPSPARIVASLCRQGASADSSGLVIGMLRDARTRLPVDTGGVAASWSELSITKRGVEQSTRSLVGAVSADGWFALCNVPMMEDLAIVGWHGADTTGATFVPVPANGLGRHDLFVGGTARLHGTVQSEGAVPVANARVTVGQITRIVTTDSSGTFKFDDIGAGTQTLEVRALGFAPERRTLVLTTDSDTALQIRLTTVSKVLDTIKVLAQRVYDADRNGFQQRRRMGFGRFFDENDIRRRQPFDVFSLLQQTAFLRVETRGFDRRVLMNAHGESCTPQLYLNGVSMPSDLLADLDFLVRPEEIGGMEVYTSPVQTPAQFRGFSGCGAIVFWTRPPRRPAK